MLTSKNSHEITIIGPALIDVITGPVIVSELASGGGTVPGTRMSFGGDALNEAVVLSRLGRKAGLITKIGADEAGGRVLDYIRNNGLDDSSVITQEGLETSVHIVLVDKTGERTFLMNENGSARRLLKDDILPCISTASDVVSFASLFISPMLSLRDVREIFAAIKEKPGRILAADMSRPKNRETLEDLRAILPFVDFFFPNSSEISALTGIEDPAANAKLLTDAGVSCAVVKTGSDGCIVRTGDMAVHVPAYPDACCKDTTGAGDTFAAGFLWALQEGYAPVECARFGCAAASCSIEHFGAVEGIRSIEEPMRRYLKMKDLA